MHKTTALILTLSADEAGFKIQNYEWLQNRRRLDRRYQHWPQ